MSNREIKFRMWDIPHKTFLPIDTYAVITTDFKAFGVMLKDWEEYKEGEYCYSNCQVLEQYTGLKDRNGVEIYEGDILEYISSNPFSLGEKIRLSVSYVQARFWCYGVNNGSNIGIYLAKLIDTEKCKVIGNINQNPELL